MNAISRFLFTPEESASFVDLMQFRSYADFREGIVACKGGELMAGWRYTGTDHESVSGREIEFLSYRLNELVKSFGQGWAMWTEALRLETNDYPDEADCRFPDDVSRMIDGERRTAVQEQDAHFETVAFVVLMYKPPSKAKQRFFDAMVDRPGAEKVSLERKTLDTFRKTCSGFQENLATIFPPVRLRPYTDASGHTYCDFARLLHYCATGIMRPVRVPDPSIRIDRLICGQDFHPSFSPKVGDQYVGIVSVEGVQAGVTTPAMLAAFDSLPLRYRWSTRFLFMDKIDAIGSLDAFRRKWKQKEVSIRDQLMQNPNPRVNLDAVRMVADADEAFADVSSGAVNQGLYTSVFVIYSKNLDELEGATDVFRAFLVDKGFGARIETMNATSAFLGSIPGNASVNIDRIPISTANLADLMPVATAWPGEEFCPCPFYPPYSPPLLQAETPTSTPFRLNLHVDDVGHTFIGGATGSGKSTLLCLIEAQFLKYQDARIFAFDKGLSMYALAHGAGGNHFELGADPDGVVRSETMMPLSDIDTRSGLLWTMGWVEELMELQGLKVTPSQRRHIQKALELLRESPSRTITEFKTNLQDTQMREVLEFYVIGGAAGHILDGDTESATFGNFNVFEIGELMSLGDKVVLPTLMYLFRRIEQSLDGRPTLIVLDECWFVFDHPVFREKLREWLKTFRKSNAAVVMATQSISDALKSEIITTILESVATTILLPHPSVADDQNRPLYANVLSLNDREIELLAHGVRKKQYYYRSELGKRMFELNLRPKTLAFVGRSGKEDILALRALLRDHPDDWRDRWLDHCAA